MVQPPHVRFLLVLCVVFVYSPDGAVALLPTVGVVSGEGVDVTVSLRSMVSVTLIEVTPVPLGGGRRVVPVPGRYPPASLEIVLD